MKTPAGALLLLLIFIAAPAVAQSIPVDIPDRPGESPADRERDKREEQFHQLFSRIYLSTSVSALPLLHRSGVVFDSFVEAGIRLGGQTSLFVVGGPRITPDILTGQDRDLRSSGGYVGALGLEFGVGPSVAPGEWAVSLASGVWTGEVDFVYVEVSPKYIRRLNQYWSVTAGAKASLATFETGKPFFFAGPSVGVRRHVGQRRQLE